MRGLLRRLDPQPTGYVCEVCGDDNVARRDIWDYCPQGHVYVGKRAEQCCFACSGPGETRVVDTDGETKPACGMHARMVLDQGGRRP